MQTHMHYTELTVKCSDDGMMRLCIIIALNAIDDTITHWGDFHYERRKEHLMYFHLCKLTMLAALWPSLLPPGAELAYLRQAEETHSQETMAWGDGRACVPGIPQYTVDTLLWHLQGQPDRYSVIHVWEKVVLPVCDWLETNSEDRVTEAGDVFNVL